MKRLYSLVFVCARATAPVSTYTFDDLAAMRIYSNIIVCLCDMTQILNKDFADHRTYMLINE